MKTAIINSLAISSTSKSEQLKKQLNIIKKFKFATENAKKLVEQPQETQKYAEEPELCKDIVAEEEEDFRDEIERRFQQSAVNANYRFPRRSCDSDSESSDGSLEEELAKVSIYDLSSQNERNYGETQIFLCPKPAKTVTTLKKVPSVLLFKEPVQEPDERKTNLNLPGRFFQTYDDRIVNQRDQSNQKVLNESAGNLQMQPLKKLDFDSFDYRGSKQNNETPATNDTADSTPYKGSLNVFDRSSISSNPSKTQLGSSPFQRRIVNTNRFKVDSNQSSMKELPTTASYKAAAASNLNAINCQAATPSSKGNPQLIFFPCKNKPESNEPVNKIRFKPMNTIRVHSRSTENRLLKRKEVSCYGFEKSPRIDNGDKSSFSNCLSGALAFSSYDRRGKANVGFSAIYQLRNNTSNLYTKTKSDLLRKEKTDQMDYNPIKSAAIQSQAMNSSDDIGAFKAHPGSKNSSLSPRVHNNAMLKSPRALNPKKLSELRVAKIGRARANLSISSKQNSESSQYSSPRHLYQQTAKAQSRNSNLKVFEKKLESMNLRLDLKNVSQKSGVMSDRLKMESLLSFS